MKQIDNPNDIEKWLDRNLLSVQKPGRYIGGELNQVVKDWNSIPFHIALTFPDIYDIGLPNLGLTILYNEINNRTDSLAERVYLPWMDMESAMRAAGVPLYSLESKHPVAQFDVLGITLPYESLFTNALNLLDLAQIPIHAKDRGEDFPLVIAGGNAVSNPEAMADFIDLFVVGDGEGFFDEMISILQKNGLHKGTKKDLLEQLLPMAGVYIPSYYHPSYHPNGIFDALISDHPKAPEKIIKRIAPTLPPPPSNFIVPSINVVHNRVSIEIMRGCSRGCRFCHAGFTNRPIRERPVEQILSSIDKALERTGFEEVALLSLSSSDYSQIVPLVSAIKDRYLDEHLTISLPSLRIESLSVEILEGLKGSRQGSFTLAPEAATEETRNRINKPIPSDDLLRVTEDIFQRGWRAVKLYFMIGHPSESLDDIRAIAELCKSVLFIGRKYHGNRTNVHAGISTFVPKAHTPFQWAVLDSIETITSKLNLLKSCTRVPGIRISWTDPQETSLESLLSRGDRRLSNVIYTAWKTGARFDAWQDHFRYDIWQKAMEDSGLSWDFYTTRARDLEEALPWDHISMGVSKRFLRDDYHWSLEGKIREDCSTLCSACGILPAFNQIRKSDSPVRWKCPDNDLAY